MMRTAAVPTATMTKTTAISNIDVDDPEAPVDEADVVVGVEVVIGATTPTWLAGHVSPQALLTILHPSASFGHSGFVEVGSQFPVSIPPVSMAWPLSTYVVAA